MKTLTVIVIVMLILAGCIAPMPKRPPRPKRRPPTTHAERMDMMRDLFHGKSGMLIYSGKFVKVEYDEKDVKTASEVDSILRKAEQIVTEAEKGNRNCQSKTENRK